MYLFLYIWVVCLPVHVHCVHAWPAEARELELQILWAAVWVLRTENLGPLKEQPVIPTTETFLDIRSDCFKGLSYLEMIYICN